jgi:hypothetical protein
MVENRPMSSASTKQVFHYLQSTRDDKFQKYDYGSIENEKRYGQKRPPAIDLTTIETPVAMFVGM